LNRRHARAQRGFSVVELLLSVALLTVLGLAAAGTFAAIARAAGNGYASARGANDVDRELETLRDEAASAFAVFVPGGAAPEVDFYAKTDSGRDLFWRYVFDSITHTLRRTDYDPGGADGVRDPVSGTIDARATYPPLLHVVSFSARVLQANELGSARNRYGAVSGALIGTGAHALPVSFDNGPVRLPDAFGGNAIVQLELGTAGATRMLHLLGGALPTGFTYHALPIAHGIVYRIDQTHRFWFGLAQVSHTWIDGHVDVSYDRWRTRIAWCDFNIYGGEHGIDPHGPQAAYDPDDYNESFAGLLARTQTEPACGTGPPGPGMPGRTSPFTPPPAIVDSPPPCFTSPPPHVPPCWPPSAPPDWAPSPLPSGLPPHDWCLTHPASPACRWAR
jgi:hypothetical protein